MQLKQFSKLFLFIAVLFVARVQALELDEHTAKAPKVCTTCTQQVQQPAQPAPAPAPKQTVSSDGQLPSLFAAQRTGPEIVKMEGKVVSTERFEIPKMRKTLVEEVIPIKVPVERTEKESYIVEVTRPVEMTGTHAVTKYVGVPYSYQTNVTDQCGNICYTQTHTGVHQKAYTDYQQYAYTVNKTEQRVRQRDVTKVHLVDGTTTQVVEVMVPAVEVFQRDVIDTTITYRESTIYRVPTGK